uniref:Cilia and flagella associated protein 99 n=1 Tax=Seriola lalandi dorsalis TaxID=1841481 RepID=A0A3B4WYC9_SERLL
MIAYSYGSLVKEAIVLLDKFSTGRQCLDDFIEDASKALQKFMLDVVSGCIEHKRLLDIVINVFYGQNGKCLSRGERSQFVIICYFATFVLDDIGLQCFSNIVKSLDIKKMHTVRNSVFLNTSLSATVHSKHWIGPLLRWRPEIDILIDQLAVKISEGSQVKKAPIKTTEPQEFPLTKPKLRPLPVLELIPQQEKSKPVPNSTYRAPKEMQMIEEIKQKNHQKAEVQCLLLYNWPIKLNSAAILRQGALYDRQVEEELQRYSTRLIKGAREPSSFLQWQKEMREKDLQEELAKIERRRLEGRISYEEAAMARTRIMEHNQRTAQLKKEEVAELMRRYAEKRLQEEKEMRDLVLQVAEGHKSSKMAKEKLQKFKQTIVKEVSVQRRELLRQALEEAQAELSRKFEIIREIRTIESLPHFRVKNFDDTETAGHELLGEMSLAELKERLALLKEVQQTEQLEKRDGKMGTEEGRHTNTQISHRHEFFACCRKEERKARLGFRQTVTQDETLSALQKKLEEKQQERQRLKHTESNKAKTCEQAAVHTNTGTHNKVSMKSKALSGFFSVWIFSF